MTDPNAPFDGRLSNIEEISPPGSPVPPTSGSHVNMMKGSSSLVEYAESDSSSNSPTCLKQDPLVESPLPPPLESPAPLKPLHSFQLDTVSSPEPEKDTKAQVSDQDSPSPPNLLPSSSSPACAVQVLPKDDSTSSPSSEVQIKNYPTDKPTMSQISETGKSKVSSVKVKVGPSSRPSTPIASGDRSSSNSPFGIERSDSASSGCGAKYPPTTPSSSNVRQSKQSMAPFPKSERQQLALLKALDSDTSGCSPAHSAEPAWTGVTGPATPPTVRITSSPRLGIPSTSKGATPASSGSHFTTSATTPTADKINRRNKKGETPLHLACIKGDLTQVNSLLDAGANVDAKDNAGWTPLHEACNHGHLEISKTLLLSGARCDARGFGDDTPLHDAAANGHVRLVRILLRAGADASAKNKDGVTPRDAALKASDSCEGHSSYAKIIGLLDDSGDMVLRLPGPDISDGSTCSSTAVATSESETSSSSPPPVFEDTKLPSVPLSTLLTATQHTQEPLSFEQCQPLPVTYPEKVKISPTEVAPTTTYDKLSENNFIKKPTKLFKKREPAALKRTLSPPDATTPGTGRSLRKERKLNTSTNANGAKVEKPDFNKTVEMVSTDDKVDKAVSKSVESLRKNVASDGKVTPPSSIDQLKSGLEIADLSSSDEDHHCHLARSTHQAPLSLPSTPLIDGSPAFVVFGSENFPPPTKEPNQLKELDASALPHHSSITATLQQSGLVFKKEKTDSTPAPAKILLKTTADPFEFESNSSTGSPKEGPNIHTKKATESSNGVSASKKRKIAAQEPSAQPPVTAANNAVTTVSQEPPTRSVPSPLPSVTIKLNLTPSVTQGETSAEVKSGDLTVQTTSQPSPSTSATKKQAGSGTGSLSISLSKSRKHIKGSVSPCISEPTVHQSPSTSGSKSKRQLRHSSKRLEQSATPPPPASIDVKTEVGAVPKKTTLKIDLFNSTREPSISSASIPTRGAAKRMAKFLAGNKNEVSSGTTTPAKQLKLTVNPSTKQQRSSPVPPTTSSIPQHPPAQPVNTSTNPLQQSVAARDTALREIKTLRQIVPDPAKLPPNFEKFLFVRKNYTVAPSPAILPSLQNQGPEMNLTSLPPGLTPALVEAWRSMEMERFQLATRHRIEQQRLTQLFEQEQLRACSRTEAMRGRGATSAPIRGLSACSFIQISQTPKFNGDLDGNGSVNQTVPSADPLLPPLAGQCDDSAASKERLKRFHARIFRAELNELEDRFSRKADDLMTRQRHELSTLRAVHKTTWKQCVASESLKQLTTTGLILGSDTTPPPSSPPDIPDVVNAGFKLPLTY